MIGKSTKIDKSSIVLELDVTKIERNGIECQTNVTNVSVFIPGEKYA